MKVQVIAIGSRNWDLNGERKQEVRLGNMRMLITDSGARTFPLITSLYITTLVPNSNTLKSMGFISCFWCFNSYKINQDIGHKWSNSEASDKWVNFAIHLFRRQTGQSSCCKR